jgi:transposase
VGSAESVRKWVRDAEAGRRPGGVEPAVVESAELKRLKREVAELRRANEILKAAAGFFAAELDRPHRSW